jgi:pyruvate kinase
MVKEATATPPCAGRTAAGGRGALKPGDTYAITCGEPMGYPGGTNMLKVCRVD